MAGSSTRTGERQTTDAEAAQAAPAVSAALIRLARLLGRQAARELHLHPTPSKQVIDDEAQA